MIVCPFNEFGLQQDNSRVNERHSLDAAQPSRKVVVCGGGHPISASVRFWPFGAVMLGAGTIAFLRHSLSTPLFRNGC